MKTILDLIGNLLIFVAMPMYFGFWNCVAFVVIAGFAVVSIAQAMDSWQSARKSTGAAPTSK